jgi:hypothetical protein
VHRWPELRTTSACAVVYLLELTRGTTVESVRIVSSSRSVVASSLDTIPGCVAVALIDTTTGRVVAECARADRLATSRAGDVYGALAGGQVGRLHGVMVGNAAAARQVIVKTPRHVHLYDRVGPLVLVAVCTASTAHGIGAMLAAFRITCRAMQEVE